MRRRVFSSDLPARAVSYTVDDTAGFEHRPDSPGTAPGLRAVRCRGPSGRADRAAALRPVDEHAPLSRVAASGTKLGRMRVAVYGAVRRIMAGTGGVRERDAERGVQVCAKGPVDRMETGPAV